MPAFSRKSRYRRKDDAPRIEPSLWVRVMARRVEGQLHRDGLFGFVSWNYLFRSAVNLSRTLYSYESPENGTCKGFTAKDLQEGAISICRALYGKYTDVNGKLMDVRGDMTKVRFVPGLGASAKRLLQKLRCFPSSLVPKFSSSYLAVYTYFASREFLSQKFHQRCSVLRGV